MQVLCKVSPTVADIHCPVCHQSFHLYFERTSTAERAQSRLRVLDALQAQHTSTHSPTDSPAAHPRTGFNVPAWSGPAAFSGAALLGGVQSWAL